MGHMGATGTGQAGHLFVLLTQFDAEEVGDHRVGLFGVDTALRRLTAAIHQPFGERAATGSATGTTVGVGKKRLHIVDPRIFVNKETLVGNDQNSSQYQPQGCHEAGGDGDACQFDH